MAKMTMDEVAAGLRALPGWEYKDGAIRKLFRFDQFMDGIEFVNRIAEVAESADHHPDMTINYTRIAFVCTTHSAGGVTDKDLKLASEIEHAYHSRSGA